MVSVSEGGNAWKSYGAAESTKFGTVQLHAPLSIFRTGAQKFLHRLLWKPCKYDP